MGEYASGKWDSGSERWTNVPKHRPKLGLFRRQAKRHGMETDDWGREPDRDSHPAYKKETTAMSGNGKGKGARGFDWSNMQPRGK